METKLLVIIQIYSVAKTKSTGQNKIIRSVAGNLIRDKMKPCYQ